MTFGCSLLTFCYLVSFRRSYKWKVTPNIHAGTFISMFYWCKVGETYLISLMLTDYS